MKYIEEFCTILIKHIQDELEKLVNNSIRHLNLTKSQLQTLMFLNKNLEVEVSLKDLENHLEVAQSTSYGIVKRLESKGFVNLLEDNKDKRIKLVKITKEGQRVSKDAYDFFKNIENKLLSELTEIESKILLDLLKKIYYTLK